MSLEWTRRRGYVRVADELGRTIGDYPYTSPYAPYSYLVFECAGRFYARNGRTGELEFSGTDLLTVTQEAINASSEGIVYLKDIEEPAGLTYKDNVIIVESYKGRTRVKGTKGTFNTVISIFAVNTTTGGRIEAFRIDNSADDNVCVVIPKFMDVKGTIEFAADIGAEATITAYVEAGVRWHLIQTVKKSGSSLRYRIPQDGWILFYDSADEFVTETKFASFNRTKFNLAEIDGVYLVPSKVSTLPTPEAAYRGHMIRVEGAAGVADKLYICMKTAADTYTWVEVASG